MQSRKLRARWCATVAAGAFALAGTAATVSTSHASDGAPGTSDYSSSSHWDAHSHAAPGVVTGWSDAPVRDAPNRHAQATSTLAPGTHIELFCQTSGGWAHGTSTWYFDNNAHGWVSAAHVQPTAWQPPDC